MSKRCELQKEYYQTNGAYKGNGTYNDKYVRWLEDQILALRKSNAVALTEQLKCGNSNPPCSPNIKFGCLECTECNWSEF